MVPGLGHRWPASTIAEHPGIAKIAFTGSDGDRPAHREGERRQLEESPTRAGRQGRQHRLRGCQPRCRGQWFSAWAIFHNQGQACIAGSRLVLARGDRRCLPREASSRWRSTIRLRAIRSMAEATEMGPLTSALHRDRVLAYVDVARSEQGGEVLARWQGAIRRRASSPGLLRRADDRACRARFRDRVAQEEVFGPFVTVLTFQAPTTRRWQIANGTDYGLGSGLWTQNLQRAHKHGARDLYAGMVWINSYKRVNPGSPFGGFGQIRLRARDGFRRDARIHAGQAACGSTSTRRSPRTSSADDHVAFRPSNVPAFHASSSASARLAARSADEVERLGARACAGAVHARTAWRRRDAVAHQCWATSAAPVSSRACGDACADRVGTRRSAPSRTARSDADCAVADRRGIDHRPGQGDRPRLRVADRGRCPPPTRAAR